ncbi:MAG TPA: nuclear transport factor 2 family protein, partial [Streptosporangiaceae bacterium]|nr:nuclear transport factor 2 family protein [Streptosporangiaceae bacterium]
RVLAERRFVIDFAAGRRMVVTDDIEAKLAITEVSYRCCRALDRMDPDLMDTVWHPDGTADYGPAFRGSASGLLEVMWAPASTEERGCTCSRSHSFGPVSRRMVRGGATTGCAGLRGC